MGKKSKRKSNNKPPCYHGCTKKEFNNCGEHHKVMESFDHSNEFCQKYKHVLVDPTFGRFVIAHVTSDYLKGNDDAILLRRLMLLLRIRYWCIPQDEGKDVGPESEYDINRQKYSRDITTERGRIKCIAREIPSDCKCMEEKKKEAKRMEKVAMCYGCRKDFLKEQMRRCKGCDAAQYCSHECYKQDWPRHKTTCDNK